MKEYIVNLADISEYGRRMIIGNGIPKEELIRCKDCYWHYGTLCRKNNTMPWEDDDFCSKAERKEE